MGHFCNDNDINYVTGYFVARLVLEQNKRWKVLCAGFWHIQGLTETFFNSDASIGGGGGV